MKARDHGVRRFIVINEPRLQQSEENLEGAGQHHPPCKAMAMAFSGFAAVRPAITVSSPRSWNGGVEIKVECLRTGRQKNSHQPPAPHRPEAGPAPDATQRANAIGRASTAAGTPADRSP